MENEKVDKQIYISMIIGVIIFILGLIVGLIIGMNINRTEKVDNKGLEENIVSQNVNNEITEIENTAVANTINQEKEYKPKLSKEDRKKTSLAVTMSTEEKSELKATVEKDEADYGNDYQKFTSYRGAYKREPDTIYFKSPKVEGFYKFEKDDENYKHLLEVSEDRMSYSVMEDFNLYCFTPDSVSTMMTSGDNYIIFDYDNKDLEEGDIDFQKPLVFRFNTNTRLFRLATSLSCDKDLILVEDLGKKEFATDTKISGYKYMIGTNQDN